MPISASNAITAKVRAKFGARLTDQNYRDMMALGSVAEVASYLKTRTKYAAALNDIRESAVHRGNLERLLNEYYLTEMSALCRFERNVGDKMAAVLTLREELKVVLDFLRYLAVGKPEQYLLVSSAVSDSLVSFDLRKMAASRNLAELKTALGASPFAKAIAGFAKADKDKFDYTIVESVLNRELYEFEVNFVNKNFSGAAKRELLDIIGMRADLQNAMICYRAKKYFNTDNGLILPQLIDTGLYVSKTARAKMAAAENADEVLEILKSTHYGEHFRKNADMPIDKLCSFIICKKLSRFIRMSTSPDVVSLCYTGLMTIEMNNVITIIEGVRYSLPPESIKKMLITEGGD